MKALKAKLDHLARAQNSPEGLAAAPDPLQIARPHRDEFIALLCALFAYGGAGQITNFLGRLDFSLLDSGEEAIRRGLRGVKYRFQTERDLAEIFIALARLKGQGGLEDIFVRGAARAAFQKSPGQKIPPDTKIASAILEFIHALKAASDYSSPGFDFFFGRAWTTPLPSSPLKRFNMFLRWMVRRDELDLGLWQGLGPAQLLIPLDTHTHRVALALGLMKRRSYDFAAAVELTEALRKFDPTDPVKYDFALYRLGQSGELEKFKTRIKSRQAGTKGRENGL